MNLKETVIQFGAEHLLMQRCQSRELFEKTVKMINDFKDYFTRHEQGIYENPSPGNKEGGITTLEEKSLGGPVPTMKIATNRLLAAKKQGWIDFDASPVLEGRTLTEELLDYVISVAEGEETKNEKYGYKEISIFKDGIVL